MSGSREGDSERRRGLVAGLRRHGLVRRPAALREWTDSRALRFVEGNEVDVYQTGSEGLAAMLEAIESASEFVHLESYILRADATGRRFLDALTARARAGCDVRVLYDGVGSLGLDPAVFDALRREGGEAHVFNPLGKLWPKLAPRRRDHRKLLIVDGRCAFTGGLNIGAEYARGLRPGEEWRDAHVRVRGPIVRELEAVFLESWFRADAPGIPWNRFLDAAPEPAGDARCAVLADGPVYKRGRLRDLMRTAVESAEREVLLASPYFAPGRRMLAAMRAAALRGVQVKLLLAGRTDHAWLRRAAHVLVPRLITRGVEVREYDDAMMHAKLAVFDGEWAIVGTSNLDRQSLEHSYEVNLVLDDAAIAGELRDGLLRDFDGARTLDAETLAARSWRDRLLDRLSSWLLWLFDSD